MEIRQCSLFDTEKIEEILLNVWEWLNKNNNDMWDKKWLNWEHLSKNYKIEECFISYIKNIPIGLIILQKYDPYHWKEVKPNESIFIHKLAVKREFSGQGVANFMINFAKDYANQNSIRFLRLDTLSTIKKLRKFYENIGFKFVREELLFERYKAALYYMEI